MKIRYSSLSLAEKCVMYAVIPAKVLEYELPLSIVKYPDPRLRAENKLVGVFDETLTILVSNMFEIMYKYAPALPLGSLASCGTLR